MGFSLVLFVFFGTFVTTNNQYRRESCLRQRVEAFLLPYILFSIPQKVSLPDVNGSQSVWPCIGSWSHRCQRHLFVLTYHEGRYIYKRITTNTMRNLIALEILQTKVTGISGLLDTKEILRDAFASYYTTDTYSQLKPEVQQDVAHLSSLFDNLLNELFLAQTLKGGVLCKN